MSLVILILERLTELHLIITEPALISSLNMTPLPEVTLNHLKLRLINLS